MTETFAERISDEEKTPLAGPFILWIKRMAVRNDIHEDQIWQMWKSYSDDCQLADQSPVLSEFCRWNKLTEVN